MTECTLGDLVALQRGNTYKGALLGLPGPVLLGLGSIERDGGFRGSKLKTYGGTSDPRMLLAPGDVFVSLKDVTQAGYLLGAVARVPSHISIGRLTQDTVKLVPKSKSVSLDLIYWTLRTPQYRTFCRSHATGTTNLGLPREDFLSFPIPALTEELANLVGLLQSLDDKIELNRRMNETLEAMARALFRDWFVDFGPTRAKMAGLAPYLSPALWDLFPASLDDEDKPEGWRFGKLGDIAKSASEIVSPSDVHDDTPYIGLEHMPRRSIALSEWEGAGKVSSNKSSFKAGDFLFGKLRPYFHKVGVTPVAGICSTDIVVIKPKTPEWSGYVLACISGDDFVAYTDKTATGTKMPRTSWPIMAKYQVVLPPKELAIAYSDLIAGFVRRMMANIQETRTLAQTRDLLLPRLMSGELRVADIVKESNQ